jgi:hypothetical protein
MVDVRLTGRLAFPDAVPVDIGMRHGQEPKLPDKRLSRRPFRQDIGL